MRSSLTPAVIAQWALGWMLLLASTTPMAGEAATPQPLEPKTAIFAAFSKHSLVALDEGHHNNEQGHALRLSLIRDKRFSQIVDDVIVEAGNAKYQPLIDRYIAGEEVPAAELRKVWQDTWVYFGLWDVPIYEEFYRAVRDENRKLPRRRQVRVLLGSAPLDWETIRSPANFRDAYERRIREDAGLDGWLARTIEREVLAKRRRALIIRGGSHLVRNVDDAMLKHGSLALVASLERRTGVRVFNIWTPALLDLTKLDSAVAAWPIPSVALLADTTLGAVPFSTYYFIDDGESPQPEPERRRYLESMLRLDLPMERQFDAVLYLGAPSQITYSKPSPELCADAEYIQMRAARVRLGGDNSDWTARFSAQCKDTTPRAAQPP